MNPVVNKNLLCDSDPSPATNPVTSTNDPLSLANFRKNLETLQEYASDEGIDMQPYLSPSLQIYTSLHEPLQRSVCVALSEFTSTMMTLRSNKEPLRNNLNSVWLTLRKRGLRAPNLFFPSLQPNDIVEIYSLEGIQIFRSFHFFQFSSFDLETLVCTPWYQLFDRNPAIGLQYETLFGDINRGRISELQFLNIPEHVVTETAGLRRSTTIHSRFVSMLYNSQQQPMAYAHALRAKTVSS